MAYGAITCLFLSMTNSKHMLLHTPICIHSCLNHAGYYTFLGSFDRNRRLGSADPLNPPPRHHRCRQYHGNANDLNRWKVGGQDHWQVESRDLAPAVALQTTSCPSESERPRSARLLRDGPPYWHSTSAPTKWQSTNPMFSQDSLVAEI